MILLIVVFWVLELQNAWDVAKWGGLVPMDVNLGTSTFIDWEFEHVRMKRLTLDTLFSVPFKHVPSDPFGLYSCFS